MNKDSFDGLSWMTNEIKNQILKQDKIIVDEDYESLYSYK
tara:strand:+ start:850 stop:969 length:120 start_codon:yes stop_codon:yes gene_type:complete